MAKNTEPPERHEVGSQRRIDERDARGAEIILRTRRRRLIFFGGLAVFVMLALVLQFVAFGA